MQPSCDPCAERQEPSRPGSPGQQAGGRRARADRAGRARQVKIYSHSPEGVVTVKFRSADAAAQCLALMAGRFFGGRRLVAELWDGVATWHAAKPKETPEEQAARLEAFARALEAGKAGGA